MFSEMFTVLRHELFEELQLRCCHCLDDKFIVVAEKEEASRTTSSFTGLKDLLSVELGTEALVEIVKVIDLPHVVQAHKVLHQMERHRNVGVQRHDLVVPEVLR